MRQEYEVRSQGGIYPLDSCAVGDELMRLTNLNCELCAMSKGAYPLLNGTEWTQTRKKLEMLNAAISHNQHTKIWPGFLVASEGVCGTLDELGVPLQILQDMAHNLPCTYQSHFVAIVDQALKAPTETTVAKEGCLAWWRRLH